jgi:hypothetical protein
MSKSAHPLDSIKITSPCTADWDSMAGNDVVRFCHHCKLHVHDLSLMTREEALTLVRNSDGRLCLRYVWRPDGTIQTAPPFQKLHLIKRRATRLVAGAFGATLALCAASSAQTPSQAGGAPESVCEVPLKTEKPSSYYEGGVASLAGTVFDANKAVIVGAKVTLVNDATKNETSALTDDEGRYRFQNLIGGSYTLVVESPGFMRSESADIDVSAAGERTFDVTLLVGTTGGAIVVVSPEDPLVLAVVQENTDAVRELLDAGADVNVIDKAYDSTPLQEAVALGNEEITELLLQRRADVRVKNARGQSAILYLNDKSTGEIVRRLVDAGADINERDEDGNTPLIITAVLGKRELLRAVIDAGAGLNDQNKAGQSALMLAAREGQTENVRLLLKAGANVMLADIDGWTALRYALENSHHDVAEMLKTRGAVE